MTTKKYSNEIYLQRAKKIFTEIEQCDDLNIIGYCKLLQQIIEERHVTKLPTHTFSLQNLINICNALDKRQQDLIQLRYINNLIYEDIAQQWNITAERVRQLDARMIRALQQKHVLYWYSKEKTKFLQQSEETAKRGSIELISNLPIECLDFMTRTNNALKKSRIATIGQLLEIPPKILEHIKHLGIVGINDIRNSPKYQYYFKITSQD